MAQPNVRGPGAASLTEWLRQRTDEQLAALLRRRPDLGLPAPADLATLASRISVRTSVQRAVDGLDQFALRVLETLVLLADRSGHVTVDDAVHLLRGVARSDVQAAVDTLLDTGLAWGDATRLTLVATVPDAVGPYPVGLGRPAHRLFADVPDVTLAPVLRTLGIPPAAQPRSGALVAECLATPEALIAACDPAEREVLDRLAAGPPVGMVRDAQVPSRLDDDLPPRRLIARGMLAPIDSRTVELPREVGLALRSDRPAGAVTVEPPAIPLSARAGDVDAAGAATVLTVLQRVEALAELWAQHPPTALRAGGVGVRDLRRTARDLDLPEADVAVFIEAMFASGLLGTTSAIDPVFLPTSEFDSWRRSDPSARWVSLASAWLAMTSQPSLVSQRDDRERLITVLGPDAERHTIPALRRQVLGVLAGLPDGAAPAAREDVLARLAWEAPRRISSQRQLAEAVLGEADMLGVTAGGGLTSYSRALLDASRQEAERRLGAALPEPVDHFLVQPDLTVVVPGPPEPDLGRELALVADLESSGGASVYRVTPATVRRALDAGRTGTDLQAFFADTSRTPVPQALAYLIDDAAKRHGVLRTGPASAYLRCDDPGLLDRVLAERAVDGLGLRRLAPTVVVATVAPNRLLDVLRDAGYFPAAEASDGMIVSLAPDSPRAPSRSHSRLVRPRPGPADTAAHLEEIVRRLRAGDALAEVTRRTASEARTAAQQVPGVTSATMLGLLREAIRGSATVRLSYIADDGTPSRRTITPISMAGGTLRGHDTDNGRLAAFPLHRITSVSVAEA